MSIEGTLVPILYLLSAVIFILGLKGLTKVKTAQRGNMLAAVAMLIAVVATLLELGQVSYTWILVGLAVGGLIGAMAAIKVQMTEMPEMVALFNGSGGGASALVAASVLWGQVIEADSGKTAWDLMGAAPALTTILSMLIGALTLSGSIVAYMKLAGKMSGNPILLPGRHVVNALLLIGSLGAGFWAMSSVSDIVTLEIVALAVLLMSLVLGVMLVIPIGGADMPVVISLLNSYSGIAAAATGFVLMNNVLIISGALVGASGLILTQIMCVAMNRTLANVLFGGFGGDDAVVTGMNGQLVLRAATAVLDQLQAVVDQLDRAPRRLLIALRHARDDASSRVGTRLGATVTTREGDTDARLRARAFSTDSHERSDQDFVVQALEGRPALVSGGQLVPYVSRSLFFGPRGGVVADSVQLEDVSSGFYALPRVTGDTVMLEIYPYTARLDPGFPGSIRYTDAQTVVSGRLGEWLDIGTATTTGRERSSALGAATRRDYQQADRFQVRVTPLD